MTRCKGIIVRDAPFGITVVAFEDGERIHLPIRCRGEAEEGDPLCRGCIQRHYATEAAEAAGALATEQATEQATAAQPLSQYLNGIVGEPLPHWSRMAGSSWYREKLKGGSRLSVDAMGKIKKAVERTYEGEKQPPPKTKPKTFTIKPKKREDGLMQTKLEFPVVERPPTPPVVVAPVAPVAPAAPAAPVAPAVTPPPPKKRAAPKKQPAGTVKAEVDPPVAFVDLKAHPKEIDSTRRITVKKHEIDGRSVYLESETRKVYDLKLKPLGLWDSKKGRIVV